MRSSETTSRTYRKEVIKIYFLHTKGSTMGSLYSQTIPSLLFSAAYSFNVFSSGHPHGQCPKRRCSSGSTAIFICPPPPPPPRLPTANDLKLSLSLQQVFGIDNMLMQHGFKTVIAVADDGVQPGPVRRHISVDRRRPHGDN